MRGDSISSLTAGEINFFPAFFMIKKNNRMIKRKLKPCKGCKKNVYIFSHGYGKCCYHLHQKEKRKQKIEKGEIPQGGEIGVFLEIWSERPHVSQLSGKPLKIMDVSMFAHLLSKSQTKYPKFKYYKENIWLLTPEEHHLLDHSTNEKREKYAKENNCTWDSLYKKQQELKKMYPTMK